MQPKSTFQTPESKPQTMTQTKPTDPTRYLILIHEQNAACFIHDANTIARKWTNKPIKGEALTLLKPGKKNSQINMLLQEISGQLNHDDNLASVQINLLYSMDNASLLSDVSVSLNELQCNTWQVMRLEPLLERVGKHQPIPADWSLEQSQKPQSSGARWLLDFFLPMSASILFGDTDFPPAQREPAAAMEAADTLSPEAERAQLASLREKNRTLEQCLAQQTGAVSTLQLPDAEALLSFLPALYHQVFTVLSGADLAMLMGRIEPFDIPSPYQEPSGDALDMKQRTFLALPSEQQRQIVAFAQQASQKLRPRPNMQAHIRQLQENA